MDAAEKQAFDHATAQRQRQATLQQVSTLRHEFNQLQHKIYANNDTDGPARGRQRMAELRAEIQRLEQSV